MEKKKKEEIEDEEEDIIDHDPHDVESAGSLKEEIKPQLNTNA